MKVPIGAVSPFEMLSERGRIQRGLYFFPDSARDKRPTAIFCGDESRTTPNQPLGSEYLVFTRMLVFVGALSAYWFSYFLGIGIKTGLEVFPYNPVGSRGRLIPELKSLYASPEKIAHSKSGPLLDSQRRNNLIHPKKRRGKSHRRGFFPTMLFSSSKRTLFLGWSPMSWTSM